MDELSRPAIMLEIDKGRFHRHVTPRNHHKLTALGLLALLVVFTGGCAAVDASALEAQPSPPAAPPLTWFAPNMGSADYVELFTKPDEWKTIRPKVGVLKFYTPNLLDANCAICGNNTLHTFVGVDAFRKLVSWGIAIAIEVPAVKPWGCGAKEANVVTGIIQSVEQNGGKVSFLAMDEPLEGSQSTGRNVGHGCGFGRDQAAAAVLRYGQAIHARFPQIGIGEIEPYPSSSAEQLGEWVDTLRRAGFTPAFFHLDVDRNAVRVAHKDVVKDLQWLNQFFAKRNIPFGVILWSPAKSDKEFYDSTMEWARTVKSALGKPNQIIFQNWAGADGVPHDIPANLPAHDPEFSHMRVINDALGEFNQ